MIPWLAAKSRVSLFLSSRPNSLLARLKVFALSVVMDTGLPCLPMNRFRHLINASLDRSGVSSRCKALEVAHVNRQMYAFFIPLVPFTYTGLAKSAPTWSNARPPETLDSGRSAVGGGLYGNPSLLLQITHWCRIVFTNCLLLGIQKLLLTSTRVSFTPP